MRLRAQTFSEQSARRTALAAALEAARDQGAALFELRCLIDGFDVVGDGDRAELADVIERFPGDDRWPEFVRAQQILP
jgi:hypothetical protein